MDDPLLLKLRKSKTKESEKKIDHKAKYFIWFTVFESRGVHNSCLFRTLRNKKNILKNNLFYIINLFIVFILTL